jgi:pimeloyl-ACP methyl ester carboxylesterase
VPGRTVPGWIFGPQQTAFDRQYQVVEFDPRGQGASEVTASGYNQARRGADIGDLLRLLPGRVVLVGWSLGVLDSLAYIHQAGDARLAGLVLIDNSVGENPPPLPDHGVPVPVLSRDAARRRFVVGMFRTPQPEAYIDRLTAGCRGAAALPGAAQLLARGDPLQHRAGALHGAAGAAGPGGKPVARPAGDEHCGVLPCRPRAVRRRCATF